MGLRGAKSKVERGVQRSKVVDLRELLPKQRTCEMKSLQVQVYIQSNDFIMNRVLNLCKV